VSREVDFADVCGRILVFGHRATVITVTPAATPHVVTAVVEVDGDRLLMRVGPRTLANLVVQPHVTLTWAPPDGGDHQLILDGRAECVSEPDDRGVGQISVSVERGILHRLAELPLPGPTCVAL
jgi:hypothetical protein